MLVALLATAVGVLSSKSKSGPQESTIDTLAVQEEQADTAILKTFTATDAAQYDAEKTSGDAKATASEAENQKKDDINWDKIETQKKHETREISDVLSKTKILFDLNSDKPRIQDYNDNINKTVEILNNSKTLKLIVEGYSNPNEENARDLAQRRANKVRDMFIAKGVSPGQIETAAYTDNDPDNLQNITDPNREEHRAAIFRIVKR